MQDNSLPTLQLSPSLGFAGYDHNLPTSIFSSTTDTMHYGVQRINAAPKNHTKPPQNQVTNICKTGFLESWTIPLYNSAHTPLEWVVICEVMTENLWIKC